MDVPDLIIPIRMDPAGATAGLTKVSAAGKKTGDDVDAGSRKGRKGLLGLQTGAGDATNALLNIGKAQLSFAAIKAAAAAMGSEFKRAADYVKNIASEFAELRKTMGEVAALRGEEQSNEFTLEEAKKAKQFGLTPGERRDFQAEFLNYAGSQVGTDEKTGKVAEGAKLTEAQGEEYGSRVAALMKSQHIDPKIGAELAGSMLENKKGPQDVDELMKEFSTTFQVLQKGRVPLSRALPQMSEIMGRGVGSVEAAKMFSIVAPVSPGQEGTSVQSALKAIEEMKAAGTGSEFGVKEGMSPYESVKAFSQNINDRKTALTARGKTDQEAQDIIGKLLKEKNVAADIREQRGLVAGFGRQGVELGGFERYEKIAQETPENFEAANVDKYRKSDQGKEDAAKIDQQIASAERGAEQQDVRLELERAKARTIESGAMEKSRVSNIARGTVGTATGVSTEEQLINEEALGSLRARAGVGPGAFAGAIAGVSGLAPGLSGEGERAPDVKFRSQESVNAEMRDLLRKIADNTAPDKGKPPDAEKPAGAPIPLVRKRVPGRT